MSRYAGDGHEQPAEMIKTIRELLPHLCDLAYANRLHSDKLQPEKCAQCVSPCFYGKKLLILLKENGQDYGAIEIERGKTRKLFADAPIDRNILRALRSKIRFPYRW